MHYVYPPCRTFSNHITVRIPHHLNVSACPEYGHRSASEVIHWLTARNSLPSAVHDNILSVKTYLFEQWWASLWHFCDSGAVCKCHDLLTYLTVCTFFNFSLNYLDLNMRSTSCYAAEYLKLLQGTVRWNLLMMSGAVVSWSLAAVTAHRADAVSYTHLTLPTKRIV